MKRKMMNLDELVMRDMMLRIEKGEFSPGERLPTERALAESYSVQRMTARAALERLVDRGYATVSPRDGYFAAPRRVRVRISQRTDFLRDFLRGDVEWTGAEVKQTAITEKLANKTFLPRDSLARELVRSGLLAQETVALEQWFFPLCAQERGRSASADPWALIEEGSPAGAARFAKTAWFNCRMDVVFAKEREAERLGVQPLAPVYLARVHGYASDGGVTCFREILLRADRFEFENHTDEGQGEI